MAAGVLGVNRVHAVNPVVRAPHEVDDARARPQPRLDRHALVHRADRAEFPVAGTGRAAEQHDRVGLAVLGRVEQVQRFAADVERAVVVEVPRAGFVGRLAEAALEHRFGPREPLAHLSEGRGAEVVVVRVRTKEVSDRNAQLGRGAGGVGGRVRAGPGPAEAGRREFEHGGRAVVGEQPDARLEEVVPADQVHAIEPAVHVYSASERRAEPGPDERRPFSNAPPRRIPAAMIPLQTASRHPVTHILFSPDESTVAVAQPHYGVTLLDRATGRTRAVCAMPRRAALTGLAFCAGGTHLAAAHPKGIEVFDAATGAAVASNFDYPQRCQLARAGGTVVGAASWYGRRAVLVRELLRVTGGTISPFPTKALVYRDDLALVVCAPDASHVLCTKRNRLVLLNVAADRSAAEFERPGPEPDARLVASFCPLGRRFAINDGRTLDVYEIEASVDEEDEDDQQADIPLVQRANGAAVAVAPMPHALLAPTFTLSPAKRRPGCAWQPPFALAADGRGLLVKRPGNRIQLWDGPTGTLVSEWSWRLEWVTCVAVSTDGLTAVAGGRFGRVLLWDLE